MKYISILLILSLLILSCSSNTWIKKLPMHQKYEKEINYLGEDRLATIILKNNLEIETLNLQIIGDSLKYSIESWDQDKIVALNDVKQIKFKDHIVGGFYGLIGGLGCGVVVGYASIDWDQEMAGLGMLLYGGIGILTGSILGSILGSDLNYIILNDGNLLQIESREK